MLVYFFQLGVYHSEAFTEKFEPFFLEMINDTLELLLPLPNGFELFESLTILCILSPELIDDFKVASLHLLKLSSLGGNNTE